MWLNCNLVFGNCEDTLNLTAAWPASNPQPHHIIFYVSTKEKRRRLYIFIYLLVEHCGLFYKFFSHLPYLVTLLSVLVIAIVCFRYIYTDEDTHTYTGCQSGPEHAILRWSYLTQLPAVLIMLQYFFLKWSRSLHFRNKTVFVKYRLKFMILIQLLDCRNILV